MLAEAQATGMYVEDEDGAPPTTEFAQQRWEFLFAQVCGLCASGHWGLRGLQEALGGTGRHGGGHGWGGTGGEGGMGQWGIPCRPHMHAGQWGIHACRPVGSTMLPCMQAPGEHNAPMHAGQWGQCSHACRPMGTVWC